MDDKQIMLLEEFKALRAEMLGTINDRVWESLVSLRFSVALVSCPPKPGTRQSTSCLFLRGRRPATSYCERERGRIRIGA